MSSAWAGNSPGGAKESCVQRVSTSSRKGKEPLLVIRSRGAGVHVYVSAAAVEASIRGGLGGQVAGVASDPLLVRAGVVTALHLRDAAARSRSAPAAARRFTTTTFGSSSRLTRPRQIRRAGSGDPLARARHSLKSACRGACAGFAYRKRLARLLRRASWCLLLSAARRADLLLRGRGVPPGGASRPVPGDRCSQGSNVTSATSGVTFVTRLRYRRGGRS
jgi:hypothetical protein